MTNLLEDEELCKITVNEDGIRNYCISDSARSRRAIDMNINEQMRKDLVNHLSAPDMLAALIKKYGGKNKARKLKLIKDIATFEMGPGETLEKLAPSNENLAQRIDNSK